MARISYRMIIQIHGQRLPHVLATPLPGLASHAVFSVVCATNTSAQGPQPI